MTAVKLTESKEVIKASVSNIDREAVECDIAWLTSRVKSNLIFFINEMLKYLSLNKYIEDAGYIIIELISNAIKARYAHIITIRNLKMLFPQYKEKFDNDEYLNDIEIMFQYSRILQDEITKSDMKEIIKMENDFFQDTSDNIKKYDRLMSFRYDTKKEFAVKIIAEKSKRDIIFTVESDSPMTMISRTRVEAKRMIFREYYNNNSIEKFFLEQLDTSEGAGFGLALVDLRLLMLGLEPKKHLIIDSKGNQTFAKLILPMKLSYSPIRSYDIRF